MKSNDALQVLMEQVCSGFVRVKIWGKVGKIFRVLM